MAGLVARGGCRVKLLSRNKDGENLPRDAVETVAGDLLVPQTLKGFLEPGCTVVNLVYLWGAGEADNLAAIGNLVQACREAGVKRLIHVSTAAVVGRVNDNVVSEATPCQPVSDYGITKLNVERLLQREGCRDFDLTILRPTSVFGPGGEPLRKLAGDLKRAPWLRNYMKSCLFRGRRMNLVHIANVVEAIIFLANHPEDFNGEVFIVSDDDSSANNFTDVELALMHGLDVPDYRLPPISIPLGVLGWLLSVLGRNNANPKCDYIGEKLLKRGFCRPVSFETGLAEYIADYRMRCSSKSASDARP